MTIRHGRRTLDGIRIERDGVVRNDAEIFTYTAISDGTIEGRGTWWAHVSSKTIGGFIGDDPVVIYWPFDRRFVLPVVFGGLICIPKTQGEGGLS